MVAVRENGYIVTDDEGEIYLCNARCLCLWSMTLATRPGLPEEMKMQSLKLIKPNAEVLDFESLSELASWAATNALQTTLVRTSE
jgi:hypothetical protein